MFLRKKGILMIAASIIMMLSLASCQAPNASAEKAPDFTLNDLDGKPFSLSSTVGKVVVINFFATWCPPCRMEVPDFQDLHERYAGQGLVIVGISMDQGGAADVKPFVKANGVTYTVVMGNQNVAARYGGIRGIPTTFLIDREGNISQKMVGYRPKETIEAAVRELL
ncbi:MAG: TlpA disulfide reductase family protein [Candidatus Omnitrophica bacterium]|nr:TlpA disulfide reductase family protein [Candidatus Omnitrophota bacterium]